MSDKPAPSIGELFLTRVDLGRRIAALQADKMAREREGFGADILLLDPRRTMPDGGNAVDETALAQAGQRADAAKAAVASLEAAIAALDAEVGAIDRQIAERTGKP